ncbi:hypothetical protein DFH07DRAFT_987310 [Mycena maculata]|uniref:Uncharacterized protein n=1 Tax=Mycena maculata TaxID=230809 RepID=A0AAD7I752_9AGAR|nr:hypothetical protein DFH07DRAFT_987310 [Mycena maculata]
MPIRFSVSAAPHPASSRYSTPLKSLDTILSLKVHTHRPPNPPVEIPLHRPPIFPVDILLHLNRHPNLPVEILMHRLPKPLIEDTPHPSVSIPTSTLSLKVEHIESHTLQAVQLNIHTSCRPPAAGPNEDVPPAAPGGITSTAADRPARLPPRHNGPRPLTPHAALHARGLWNVGTMRTMGAWDKAVLRETLERVLLVEDEEEDPVKDEDENEPSERKGHGREGLTALELVSVEIAIRRLGKMKS